MKYYKNNLSITAVNDGDYLVDPTGWEEITEEEYNRIHNIHNELNELHYALKRTDYKAIKYAEGLYTDEEYKAVKEQRQALRDRINELKASI